jgi:hypothetical protein
MADKAVKKGLKTRKKQPTKTSWKAGQTGNPGGRPSIPEDLKQAFKLHTWEALDRLLKILSMDDKSLAGAQVRAAEVILNRAWGCPTTVIDATVTAEHDARIEEWIQAFNGIEKPNE